MRSQVVNAELVSNILRGGNTIRPLIQTLGATFTIAVNMPHLMFLDPGGAGRTVLLPAEASSKGLFFRIFNTADATEVLTVKEDAGSTTIGTIGRGSAGWFFCDGTTWFSGWGQASTDNMGFFGSAPIAQPSGADQGAFTDNSGGTKTLTIPATVSYQLFSQHLLLASLVNSQEFQYDPGFAGSLIAINARCVIAATTGSKLATLTGRVNAGALGGGGVVALTSANMTPAGAAVAGTAITGAKAFTAAQTFGAVVSSVTAFVEGSVAIEYTLRNDDLNNYIAQQAASWAALRTALVNLGLWKGAA